MEQRLIDANKILYDCDIEYGCDKICNCDNCSHRIVTEKAIKDILPVLIISEYLTNGDMIRALFPSVVIRVVIESQIGISFFDNQSEITWIPMEWWNEPYKRGEKDADSN